ncbi:MAG: hypothetical protein RLY35_1374 [Bacteroidota bacterium]
MRLMLQGYHTHMLPITFGCIGFNTDIFVEAKPSNHPGLFPILFLTYSGYPFQVLGCCAPCGLSTAIRGI